LLSIAYYSNMMSFFRFLNYSNERFIRWQNLISTCAAHTYKSGDKISKLNYLHGC